LQIFTPGNFPPPRAVFISEWQHFFDRLQQSAPRRQAEQTGVYRCAHCGLLLFTSHTCFARGHDWASFWAPISDQNIEIYQNEIDGLERFELTCSACQTHLGYEFNDGPKPTGRRLSVLLSALRFHPNGLRWAE
jgi:peptide methionine sulfoxide reductase MsrB